MPEGAEPRMTCSACGDALSDRDGDLCGPCEEGADVDDLDAMWDSILASKEEK